MGFVKPQMYKGFPKPPPYRDYESPAALQNPIVWGLYESPRSFAMHIFTEAL